MNFIKLYSKLYSRTFRRTHYPSMYFYITRRSEFHDIQELAFRDAGDFQWTDLVLRSTTMVEWKLGCVSSVPRASRVPPRYTNPSRTCDLPKRFLSRTMARLNYYVAPPFTETTVKVSRFRVHDCNLCIFIIIRALNYGTIWSINVQTVQ